MIVVLIATLTLDLALAQNQAPQLGPCSLGLDSEMQTQCMQSSGVDFNGTLFVISQNRTGNLPPGVTYDGFKRLMCQSEKQDVIVPCILQLMQKWNKTTCKDDDRYIMALKGSQILGLIEGVCTDMCMASAMQTMVQCFAAIQVNPAPILNENATILTDKFGFVGNSSATATAFCNSRQRLFSCLSPLNTECPPLIERLYTLGIDLSGMERATDTLCKNVDAYVKAQSCVTSDKPALVKCTSDVDPTLFKILDDRYRTGLTKPSEYQANLCDTKLRKADCQMKAMSSTCGDDVSVLFSTFECTSLPSSCRLGAATKAAYSALCQQVTTPPPDVTSRPKPPPLDIGNAVTGNNPGALGAGSSTLRSGAVTPAAATAGGSFLGLALMSAAVVAVSVRVL